MVSADLPKDEDITEWSNACTAYTAALLKKFPEQASELQVQLGGV